MNHLGELVEVCPVHELGMGFHEHLGQDVGLILGKGSEESATDFGYGRHGFTLHAKDTLVNGRIQAYTSRVKYFRGIQEADP
jgi:hypothetical protein